MYLTLSVWICYAIKANKPTLHVRLCIQIWKYIYSTTDVFRTINITQTLAYMVYMSKYPVGKMLFLNWHFLLAFIPVLYATKQQERDRNWRNFNLKNKTKSAKLLFSHYLITLLLAMELLYFCKTWATLAPTQLTSVCILAINFSCSANSRLIKVK